MKRAFKLLPFIFKGLSVATKSAPESAPLRRDKKFCKKYLRVQELHFTQKYFD